MAHIKVPYQYVSYPFSEEATRYSKNLYAYKDSIPVVFFFISFMPICFLLALPIDFITNEFVRLLLQTILLLPGSVTCSVLCAVRFSKLRTRWYHQKIREALTEDLSAMFPGDSETVQTALAQLTKDFTDIPKEK